MIPRETHLLRRAFRAFGQRDTHHAAVNDGVGPDERVAIHGELEPGDRLAIRGLETLRKAERNLHGTILERRRFGNRTRFDERGVAVGADKREARKALADRLLVFRVDVVMVAPKGVGPQVRRLFLEDSGVASLIAVYQDVTGSAKQMALAFAKGIGSARSVIMESTFADETETDLFGEQTVICGGVTHLIKAAYDTLVAAGYEPEMAYYECMHELKLVVDLLYEGGFTKMHDSVSKTAGYGGLTRGPRVIGPETRAAMQEVLGEIRSGAFAREWLLENQVNRPHYISLVRLEKESELEKVGSEVRQIISAKK